MLSPTHVRMARAGLNWTLKDLESKTGVNKNTISRYEAGAAILTDTLQRIEKAFKAAGVIFIDEDDAHGPGVQLQKIKPEVGERRDLKEARPKRRSKSSK